MKISDIWVTIAKQEGGYVNNPDDSGGETKYGISKSSYPFVDIKNLTLDDAEQIFIEDYFKFINGFEMFNLSPAAALVTSDFAFNSGSRKSVKTLQKSINTILKNISVNNYSLIIDGSFGSKSLNALKLVLKNQKEKDLIEEFRKERQSFYEDLPSFEVFGNGWTNRNHEITNFALSIMNGSM